MAAPLTIGARFRGPARSGNGGYTAGELAARVGGTDHCVIEVTLRQPPPLETPMAVHQPTGGASTQLLLGEVRIAEAREVERDLESVGDVDPATAAEAMTRFPGWRDHPFPTCFVCGPDRGDGDGLRIFPGPVGEGRSASLWVPDESLVDVDEPLDSELNRVDWVDRVGRVGIAVAWAALDCVGGWAGGMEGRRMVLGRMTAQVDALPVVGETHVVVGRARGTEGRKTFTSSTLYDSDSRIVARAEHTWIAVDPDAFN